MKLRQSAERYGRRSLQGTNKFFDRFVHDFSEKGLRFFRDYTRKKRLSFGEQ